MTTRVISLVPGRPVTYAHLTHLRHVARFSASSSARSRASVPEEPSPEQDTNLLDVLNSASVEQLMARGFNRARCAEILRYREQTRFTSVAELLKLRGFGQKTLARFCQAPEKSFEDVGMAKKSLIQPKLGRKTLQELTCWTALSVEQSGISYVRTNRDDVIDSAGHLPVTAQTSTSPAGAKTGQSAVIARQMLSAVRSEDCAVGLPRSDLYVMLDRHKLPDRRDPGAIQQALNRATRETALFTALLIANKQVCVVSQSALFARCGGLLAHCGGLSDLWVKLACGEVGQPLTVSRSLRSLEETKYLGAAALLVIAFRQVELGSVFPTPEAL